MKSNILDGKLVAKSIETNVRNRVLEYEENYNDNITLATIIIGNNKASKTYIKMKLKAVDIYKLSAFMPMVEGIRSRA